MDPVRVLLVDCENSPGTTIRALRRWAHQMPDLDTDRVMVWNRNAGIDVNTRTDRRELEAAILAHRPSLVLAGPLYNLYESEGKEDATLAADAIRVLNRLRTRYGFALMIEHHAPHGQTADRDMRPIGRRSGGVGRSWGSD